MTIFIDFTSGDCFERDTSYNGGNLKRNGTRIVISDVKTPNGCQKECRKHHKCKFWTWNGSNSCSLKRKRIAVIHNENKSKGQTSGPRDCPGIFSNNRKSLEYFLYYKV